MHIVEIIALVFAMMAIIKIITLLVNPRWLVHITENIFDKIIYRVIITIIALGLTAVLVYYLIISLGIVPILAASFFAYMILGLFLIQYPTTCHRLAREFLRKREMALLAMLIWLGLSLWGVYVILG